MFSGLLVFMVGVLVVIGVVAGVIVWAVVATSRRAGGSGRSTPTAATGSGQWNAQVRREGHLDLFGGRGTITLADGMLAFTPDGAESPAWAGPSTAFAVGSRSGLTAGDVTLDSQATGRLSVTVSHGRLAGSTQDTFAMLRERQASGEFIQAMRAAGAASLA